MMIDTSFSWAVIGAGPAGMAAVGKLLDHNVPADEIIWIDPEFNVGDFGSKWSNVSSNTRVGLFTQFFMNCHSFHYEASPHFPIKDFNSMENCYLHFAAEPLKWITNRLRESVTSLNSKVEHLELVNHHWQLRCQERTVQAKNVIMAIGATPKTLNFPNTEIPLMTALDPTQLSTACHAQDTVAVFGSSHSAIMIIKSLLEDCEVKKVINFYQEPLRYALYFDDWILFDDTGLKGNTAKWARHHLHGKLPQKLERIISNKDNIEQRLPECSKAIYSIGFEKRTLSIAGMPSIQYNERSGIIAPGLFGIGIAFPEAKLDRFGTLEYRVGLWKFMDYLNRVIPVWLMYGV